MKSKHFYDKFHNFQRGNVKIDIKSNQIRQRPTHANDEDAHIRGKGLHNAEF